MNEEETKKQNSLVEENKNLKIESSLLRDAYFQLEKAKKELADSEYFFRESQRAAFIGSYQTDFTLGLWTSSEVMDSIFGIDKNYARTVPGWLDIVHPDDREMMSRYLQEEVIGKKLPFDKVYRIVRKNDGETRWVYGLGKATFDQSGKILTLIGTIQDITQAKKIEDDLKESHELLSLFVKNSPIYAFIKEVTEKESRVLHASKNFAEMLNLEESVDITGKTMSELFPLPFAEKMTADDFAVVTSGNIIRLREDFNGKNYSTIKFPILFRERKLLAGYTIDITENIQTTDKLLRSKKETDKMNDFMLNRESRIIELKNEIKELKEKLAEK